jgi:hypothetical protein
MLNASNGVRVSTKARSGALTQNRNQAVNHNQPVCVRK